MNGIQRKTAWEMIGEFCREMAVLVLVFGFLDPFVSGRGWTWEQVGWVMGLTAGGLVTGIVIERNRHRLESRSKLEA